MHLTSIHDQQLRVHPGIMESCLMITVGYNPEKREVEGIIAVNAYDYATKTMINISEIMVLRFGDQLDQMINTIKWDELYAEEMANRKETA